MSNITDELNKIKNAVYGKEVRGAIHDGIKKTYDDASKEGNANMEVEMARGSHSVLNDRLNAMDEKDNQLSSQLADIEQDKADIEYVDERILNLGGLEIKGGFDSLQDLYNEYPEGTSGLYAVNDKAYGWDGNEWKDLFDLDVFPWSDYMYEAGEVISND